MPFAKPCADLNVTPSGRRRRVGRGHGRSHYRPAKAPGIGRGRGRALGKKKGFSGYDLYCWNCKTLSTDLHHVSHGRDHDERSSWVCEECYQKAREMRRCHSTKDKCKRENAELCQFCFELTDQCRFVWMWKDGRLYKSCPICPSVREGIREWVCKPDYLEDHSRARCCECKMIDLTSRKYYGRGQCCKK